MIPLPSHEASFPFHIVDLDPDGRFSGGHEILEKLQQVLLSSGLASRNTPTKPVSCLLYGPPGIGKSQTAKEFVRRNQAAFDCTFWVLSENEIDSISDFGTIGKRLGLIENGITAAACEKVRRFLEKTDKNWLLVLDNVEDWHSINRYWAQTCRSHGAILVTAREDPGERHTDISMQLERLGESEGVSLLFKQLEMTGAGFGDESQLQLAKRIVELENGLPLELCQAAGYMSISRCSLQGYVDRAVSTSTARQQLPQRFDKNAPQAWKIVLDHMPDGAASLAHLLAFLNADKVSEKLLLTGETTTDMSGHSDAVYNLVKGRLIHLHLSGDDQLFTMHRAVQEGILHDLGRPENLQKRQAAFEKAVAILRSYLPRASRLNQVGAETWPRVQRILAHLLSIEAALRKADPPLKGNLDFVELITDVGMDVFDQHLLRDGYTLVKAGVKVADELQLPDDSPVRGDLATVLGLLTDVDSYTARDEGLRQRKVMAFCRESEFNKLEPSQRTVDEEIRLHNAYTDLVCSYNSLNDFQKVEELCNKCLAKYKTWGSETEYPYEYMKYNNSYSFVDLYRGDTAAAVQKTARAVELIETKAPRTELSEVYQFNHAIALHQDAVRNGSDTSPAIVMVDELYSGRLARHGENAVLTRQSRITVGVMHHLQGHDETAEQWLRECLRPGAEWSEENVARAKFYLAKTISRLPTPKIAEATRLRGEAIETLNKLGIDLSGLVERFGGDELVAWDYLASWGYRLSLEQEKA